jgi:tRNA C32,U32 (ribose-2'-O)-methylase TrmJ
MLKNASQHCEKNYSHIYATHLASGTVSLYEIDFTKSVALVFGNEHEGVSEEITKLVDGSFIIPQVGIIQSLNISVACAVSIYEAFRQKKIAGHYDVPSLSKQRMNELIKEWRGILNLIYDFRFTILCCVNNCFYRPNFLLSIKLSLRRTLERFVLCSAIV